MEATVQYSALVLVLSVATAPGASAINCYVCDSTTQIGCAEFLSDTSLLEPEPCDSVHDASYCVKMTQVFEAAGIECYQCDGSRDFGCGELFHRERAHRLGVVSKPCSHVHNAQYCIKTTGLFAGQLGTKRFCSSRSFGDYCEWVKRPGDENTYQACVLSCSTDGCNSSTGLRSAALVVLMSAALGLAGWLSAAS